MKGETVATAKVSAKGWVVIPAYMRRRHGIEPGDEVHLVDFGGEIAIVPIKGWTPDEMLGIAKDGESLTDGLVRDRRSEDEAEMEKLKRLGRD
jgi:AbrB family looped-hinge helix DNA binding protein